MERGKKKENQRETGLKKRKKLEGVVISNKMDKTVVVKVMTKKQHPLYMKVISSTKKYKAHTEKELEVGDEVRIEQCRPISKEKKWRVIEVFKGKDRN